MPGEPSIYSISPLSTSVNMSGDGSSQRGAMAGEAAERFKIRSKKPVPLTASQEAEVKDIYYARVRAKCADEIRDFAHCATGRTMSIMWRCRNERKAMESCMVGFATRAEEDAAREEWFAKVGERRRKREEEERWKEQQREKKSEWWADY